MTYLIIGLTIFLGVHSVRIVADDWRTRTRTRIGEWPWKALYSVASLFGFGLMLWGYGLSREHPVQLWSPQTSMRHTAMLLTLVSFVLLSAAYVPNNGIKGRVHHPMVLAVPLWSLAHLLATATLANVVLFGSFLLWSTLSFIAAWRRDLATGTTYQSSHAGLTALTILVGLCGWVLFVYWLHGLLIGVRPLG